MHVAGDEEIDLVLVQQVLERLLTNRAHATRDAKER
jgi:hypothetical protein